MNKKLKLWETMLVMGSMIGRNFHCFCGYDEKSRFWILAHRRVDYYWNYDGCSCFSYMANFSAMFPKAGGQYTYITEIFGKDSDFLYGWGMFTVIQTGTIAAVAVAFGKFSAYLFPALNDAAPLFQSGEFKIT